MTSIRILETDNNRRGDLFGRLMADLFVALGYEQPRINIHKSGRELDLIADHRLESRRAVAECKATVEPIGGRDVNAFVGALDAESKDERIVTGYFVSLSGFTETAIEQEKQGRCTKIIMLGGEQVVDELVRGRIVIGKERATELSGRLCAGHHNLVLDPVAELLAHDRGWIWAIYYTEGKARTHFALIHADGTLLARMLADELVAVDRACKGSFHDLMCLNPPPSSYEDSDPRILEAVSAYRRYLVEECGFILLDGLPADSDVGSRKLRLESLFVPLHLDVSTGIFEPGDERQQQKKEKKKARQGVGSVLGAHSRLALLAAPGGGKSTLLKRLAVAYADPARREQIADGLPQCDWLPLFFRCRELRELARGSFAELLQALSLREPVRQYAAAFCAHVDRALLSGRVLLLVDGLDEISDPGDRAAFVCTLRTALQAYPDIAIVVTSREAGFRHVAAHLAAVCTRVTLSPFDAKDISRLSVAWHQEVVGRSEKVRSDAEQLAYSIIRNDRIQQLAVNPLLLTTLLLVKRWVGALPTRRTVLYGKAIEVLLMTWNTEGHEPIPEEEALPQLCYVASAMMLEGVQKISRPRLSALLQEARATLLVELGYVKGTVDEFIARVEDRSSLLMMTGHDVERGQLLEFFEFRHLTFQEFLTARAMVEGWHPGRKDTDTLTTALDPHLADEEWHEVIPLAAVMGGKATESLIQRLTERVRDSSGNERNVRHKGAPLYVALGNCLADEAAARPETITAALYEIVRARRDMPIHTLYQSLARGRYGSALREEARRAYLSVGADLPNAGTALMYSVWYQMIKNEEAAEYSKAGEQLASMIEGLGRLERCEGALGLASWLDLRRLVPNEASFAKNLSRIGSALISFLYVDDPAQHYAAGWALFALGRLGIWIPPAQPDVLGQLLFLSEQSGSRDFRRGLLSTFCVQRIASRDEGRCTSLPRANMEHLVRSYNQLDNHYGKRAVLILSWYLRTPWNDSEIAERARVLMKEPIYTEEKHGFAELLNILGLKSEP